MNKKLEEYSREELIEEIKALKRRKKFGLVWEDKKEDIVEKCKNEIPVLSEVSELSINNAPGESTNLIIEGDNFASLQVLNYTHHGKIDVIYIDPPYNTGNKDFIYNDLYVDSEDSFRHSKWLSFMDKRLQLARTLLKDDGFILISIDDNEQPQLKLLCDSIFGEQNFVETFIWEKNPNPTFLNKYSRSSAEYILCYAKNKLTGLLSLDGGIISSSETDAPLQNKGNPRRKICIKNGMANALFQDQHIKAGNYGLVDVLDDVDFVNNTNANDFTIEGTFRMTQETLYERIKNGGQLLFKTPRMSPRLSYSANMTHSAPLKTLWSEKYGTTQIGNNDIKNIFKALPFSYPKPVKLIKELLSFKDNKDAVILDFFAGSGTTGQAVLELNIEDGGARKFILCTHGKENEKSEVNISRDITYPRIKTVVTGIRLDGSKYSDGIPANVQYFTTDFIEKGATNDVTRAKLFEKSDEMIQVRENAFEFVDKNDNYTFYKNNEKFVAIIKDPFSFGPIWYELEEKNTEKLPVKLYVFSYSNYTFEDEIPDTDLKYEICAIPNSIMEVYRKISDKKEER